MSHVPLAVFAAALAWACPPLATPAAVLVETAAPAPDRAEAWTEDVLHMVAAIERLHPDPFFGVPHEEFEAAVDGVLGRIEELDDDGMAVEVMRLVALLSREGRDGHSGVYPFGFLYAPLRLYEFEDGWFVVDAQAPWDGLVGARVDAIGEHEIETACERLLPLLTGDNDSNRRAKLPFGLTSPTLLHALGLVPDRARLPLSLRRTDGTTERVEVEGGDFGMLFALANQTALPAVADELWLSDPGRAFWMRVLEPEQTLYVQYNEVRSADAAGRTLADFAAELARTWEERGLERLVVDVRNNGGGDNTTFGPLVDAVKALPGLERGDLFLLVGRATFSAAGNFTTVFQRDTPAILVGEPTGGAPNQYGDARVVELPHHPGLHVRVSTRYHAFGGPHDARLTHAPDRAVPLSSVEYFAGRDPVLEAVLGRTGGPSGSEH